jgi:hypothetical protein
MPYLDKTTREMLDMALQAALDPDADALDLAHELADQFEDYADEITYTPSERATAVALLAKQIVAQHRPAFESLMVA